MSMKNSVMEKPGIWTLNGMEIQEFLDLEQFLRRHLPEHKAEGE